MKPSNPQSALPMQGLSKRAQELLKPVPHQFVFRKPGKTEISQKIKKASI